LVFCPKKNLANLVRLVFFPEFPAIFFPPFSRLT
jgi:hypothetical protein